MNKKLLTIKLATFFSSCIFYAPIALLVRTRQGLTYSDFFMLQALLSLGICLTELPSGYLADRIGYRSCLQISGFCILLSRLTMVFATNFFMFFIETVFEILSFTFASGTLEAYVLRLVPQEKQSVCLSQIDNFGTAGFIFSTVMYALLFSLGGVSLLLWMTAFFSAVACFFYFMLPHVFSLAATADTHSQEVFKESMTAHTAKDTSFVKSPHTPLVNKVEQRLCFRLFMQAKVIKLIFISAVLSIGVLLINFFYIERLRDIGIANEWMTAIILCYSASYLLVPPLLKRFSAQKEKTLSIGVLGAAALCAFILADVHIKSVTLLIGTMIAFPFFLQLLQYLLYERQVALIEHEGLKEQMASVLSYFNIVTDALEFIFLIGASSLHLSQTFFLFGAQGILLCLCGVAFLLEGKDRCTFQ